MHLFSVLSRQLTLTIFSTPLRSKCYIVALYQFRNLQWFDSTCQCIQHLKNNIKKANNVRVRLYIQKLTHAIKNFVNAFFFCYFFVKNTTKTKKIGKQNKNMMYLATFPIFSFFIRTIHTNATYNYRHLTTIFKFFRKINQMSC